MHDDEDPITGEIPTNFYDKFVTLITWFAIGVAAFSAIKLIQWWMS